MKVILIQEVPHLGRVGDQLDVARGYARNFLIPQKLAVEATSSNLRSLEQLKGHARQREERLKQEAESTAGHLREPDPFGSVTRSDVAEALAARGINLDRKKIALEGPIKALGTYAVPIHLYGDIVAEIQVEVVRE